MESDDGAFAPTTFSYLYILEFSDVLNILHRDKPYPPAVPLDLVDDYHGTAVPDPYRWLEDAEAPDTIAWVEAENRLTRSLLDGPAREALVPSLTELYGYARTSAPVRRGSRWFYTRNDGHQNQATLLVRDVGSAPRHAP